jgi:hypothetical protein
VLALAAQHQRPTVVHEQPEVGAEKWPGEHVPADSSRSHGRA